MKCDRCENEAKVHETTRRNGVTVEKHLCEKCAADDGLATPGQGPVHELLQQFAVAHAALMSHGTPALGRQSICPECGLTFAEFKQGGMVGCQTCYRAFEAQLGPLLERAHEGASRHSGKHPKRVAPARRVPNPEPEPASTAKAAEDRTKALGALRRQLELAVKTEQYEQAAKLRDQLRMLSEPAPPAQTSESAPPPTKPESGSPG